MSREPSRLQRKLPPLLPSPSPLGYHPFAPPFVPLLYIIGGSGFVPPSPHVISSILFV